MMIIVYSHNHPVLFYFAGYAIDYLYAISPMLTQMKLHQILINSLNNSFDCVVLPVYDTYQQTVASFSILDRQEQWEYYNR